MESEKNNGRGAVLTGGSCLFGQPGCTVGGVRECCKGGLQWTASQLFPCSPSM
jgi:hypothetical protein